MKKGIAVIVVVLCMIAVGVFFVQSKTSTAKPDVTQLKEVCKLATLECRYHNIARGEQLAGKGIAHLLEKDRKIWFEYTGVAKIGIDVGKVKMKVRGNSVTVDIPAAEVIDIGILNDEFKESNVIVEKDGINKNQITTEKQKEAIEKGQQEMLNSMKQNTSLLLSAQNRAKKMIENYIREFGKIVGKEYQIKWNVEEQKAMVTEK